jgi:molybdopterin-guanine dinucleotide biosynthesis protein A
VTTPACAALLLTGGASRRFGAPKAEVQVDGERLADRNARLLAAVAAPVLEVGPGYSGLDAVREDEPGAGPLAGVAAGGAALTARGAGEQSVLVLAVDLPFVDPAFLHTLAAAPAADAVVPRVDGRAQPLCARYSPAALARAALLVDAGARSMQALLDALTVRWLDEPEWSAVATAQCFVDVDTPDDARRVGLQGPG